MMTTSLRELADRQLATAREASSGRASVTVFGGREHDLRQTVVDLHADTDAVVLLTVATRA